MLFERGGLRVVEGGQYQGMPRWDTVFQSFHNPSNLTYSQTAALRAEGEGVYLGIDYKGLSFMSSYTGVEDASFVRGIVGDVRSKRDLAISVLPEGKLQMGDELQCHLHAHRAGRAGLSQRP